MSGSKWLWVGGGVFSLLAHATAAAILTMAPAPEEEQAMIAGGVVAEVAMLGNGAFDAIESGKPEDAVTPETIQPDVAETTPQQVAEIQPTEIQPELTETVQPTDPVVSEPIEELIVPSAEVEIAAIPIPEIKPEVEPEEIKPVPEVKKEEPVKKVERQKPKAKPVRKAGEEGKSKENAKKGETDGLQDVEAAAVGSEKKGNSSTAGNADFSNYTGKVRRKVSRARVKVKGGDLGRAMVSFLVSASGQISNLRISQSSGSPAVDKAALESVKRAAPFPKIPVETGKSSWRFDLPLVYTK